MSDIDGAAAWMQYGTAYGALVERGKVGSGDFVLITAASSSVGLGAIQIAKTEGAVVIATTRTSQKRQQLLDCGADFVIATEEEDLPARVHEITQGKLARVVFDPIGGDFINVLAEATVPNCFVGTCHYCRIAHSVKTGDKSEMDLKLQGKHALVTGSSKGIGEAIARVLAHEGAIVTVHGRDREQTERVASSIISQGGQAQIVIGDLTEDEAVERLVRDAEKGAGAVAILVNNAGGSGGVKETWESSQPASWAAAYDRNVLAALRVTTRVLPNMRFAKWGRVINISSLAATMPPPTGPDYSACKAAMNAMTASLAKAVAAAGITVNAVSPGTIRSSTLEERFRAVAKERGVGDADTPWIDIERAILPMFAQVPVGRTGELEEIANAIAFIASPLAGYITGTNLRIDGGLSPSL